MYMYLFLTWSINWGIHRFCYWNLSLSLSTTCSFLGTLDSFWHSLFFNFSCRAIINVSPSISNWWRGIILCKLLLTWEIWRSHLFSISHYSLMDWWVCPLYFELDWEFPVITHQFRDPFDFFFVTLLWKFFFSEFYLFGLRVLSWHFQYVCT